MPLNQQRGEADVRTAELSLRQREQQPGFSVSLLQIVASDQFQPTIRLASALFFKNFVKRSWTVRTRRKSIAAHINGRSGRGWQTPTSGGRGGHH